ncbi:Ig-like domain-containing protein [Cohnella xylanilytica]|uniref:Ig-like domain-containing protein n=1 Tax=Cohnella xylanilytica TaxID=557555 RepID=UPI00289319C2|nr:Ig-like domain-containing protein [Cohnella xylanilytica]
MNQPPVVSDDNATTDKDTPVSGEVKGTDPDGDPLTYTKGSEPQHGTVTVNPDGTWTYVPEPGYVGPDSFTVIVDDGKGGMIPSTITVDVTDPGPPIPPNQPPTVPNYNEATPNNASKTGTVVGMDPEGDSLTYTKGSDPQHGTVTVDPDGTWTYVPEPGYVGPDSFTVIVDDGKGGTIASTITIDVTDPVVPVPPNQPPTVPDYNATTRKNSPITEVVEGMDSDGDPLTYKKGSDPQHGTVTVDPDGTWTYVPEPEYVGPDSFTVIVDDGKGGTIASTITIDVTDPVVPVPPNQPPTVPNYNETTPNNASMTGTVVGTDPDGDPLTYKKGSEPQHGTVTVNPDGTWTYTPEPGYVGEDSFTVVVDDGKGGTTTATITVDVTDPGTTPPPSTPDPTPTPNASPTVPNYNETTPNDASMTGTVVGTDPDGDPLTYKKGSEPQHGTVTVNPDGTWTYVPEPGYVGEDSFTVVVDDGKGGTTTATITIGVTDPGTTTPPPDTTEPPTEPPTETPGPPPSTTEPSPTPNVSPSVPDYNVTTGNDSSLSGTVKGTDPDGDPLTYSKGSEPQHGTVTVNPDGTWTYTPEPGYVGEDSFTVVVDDGKGGTTTATITIGVTDPGTTTPPPETPEPPPSTPEPSPSTPPPSSGSSNQPPAASDSNATAGSDSTVTGTVKGTDPDGDALTYAIGSEPQHGTATVNPDGTWTYVPAPGFVGKDSFTIIVDDGKGGKTTAVITIDVTDPGTPVQLPGTTNPPNPPNPPSPPSATPGQPPSDPTPLPANTEDGTASSGTGTGSSSAEPEDGSASRGAEEPDQPDNRLPSTASNVFNLGLFGAIALLAGLILRRNKNKAQ